MPASRPKPLSRFGRCPLGLTVWPEAAQVGREAAPPPQNAAKTSPDVSSERSHTVGAPGVRRHRADLGLDDLGLGRARQQHEDPRQALGLRAGGFGRSSEIAQMWCPVGALPQGLGVSRGGTCATGKHTNAPPPRHQRPRGPRRLQQLVRCGEQLWRGVRSGRASPHQLAGCLPGQLSGKYWTIIREVLGNFGAHRDRR